MKICIVVYSLEEFGGLEEIATTLAIELVQHGHQVSVLSTAWAPPDNQYLLRLCKNNVAFVQLPKWLSNAVSHWPTKELILIRVMQLLLPLVYLLGSALFLLGKRPWRQALTSAHHWVRGQITKRWIGADRRAPFVRLLLRWWCFRWQPDLLHIHGYTKSLLYLIDWAHTRKLPVVYVENQTPDAQFDWWQGFERSINKANLIVAASATSAQALRTLCGVTQPIVVFHPNVADPVMSGWPKTVREHRSKEHLIVTTVARLWVTKGLTYLLEAIAKVSEIHPTTHFRVHGEGELRAELVAYAEQLGLDGNAIFVGAFTDRAELSSIMAQTDIFVMSSVLEGQPLALVEAMSYGCPIVTTTVGGIPELIQDGVNGLLCPPKEASCLAQKICRLIEEPALRTRVGRAARDAYEHGPFQPAAVCNHFITIYHRALHQLPSNRGMAPSLKANQ